MRNQVNGIGAFPQEYLNYIKYVVFPRMDSNPFLGGGDGRITVLEAYSDLNISGLFKDAKGCIEKQMLSSVTGNLPNVLAKYAGADGVFCEHEWAEFINGNEWNAVLEVFHQTTGACKREMNGIDSRGIIDGKCAKGEVKVDILNKMAKIAPYVDCSFIEAIIDMYTGDDGFFSVNEYQALKNNPVYNAFTKGYGIVL